MQKLDFRIPENSEGERLDAALAALFPDRSRNSIQKSIQRGNVILEGRVESKPSFRVHAGQTGSLSIEDPVPLSAEPEDIPLDILYEDEDLLIINKPKGMVVHPAAGHPDHTVVNAVLYHCKGHLSGINGVLRPGIVHRIDMDTTGSLIICKNDKAHQSIAEQLKEHSTRRVYLGIVQGTLPDDTGTIDQPIRRSRTDRKKMAVDPLGKHAVTHYKVLRRYRGYTYCAFRLETGRTHQIRVHMASIHHPLLGDSVYGAGKSPFGTLEGQTLHAWIIGFHHPETGEYMEFKAPLPEYFLNILQRLNRDNML